MRFVQAGVLVLGAVMYSVIGAYVFTVTKVPANGGWLVPAAIWIVAVWNALVLAAFILAMVGSVRLVSAKKTRQLGTAAMVVKVASIPFFVLNFFLLAFGNVFGLVLVAIAPGLLVSILVGVVLTYLTMLSTSVYGWATVVALRREHIIGIALTIVYSVLLCLFFTDIVAGAMLFGHSRRRPPLGLLVLFLALGATLTALGVVGLLVYPTIERGLVFPQSLNGLVSVGSITSIALGVAILAGTTVVGVLRRNSRRSEIDERD